MLVTSWLFLIQTPIPANLTVNQKRTDFKVDQRFQRRLASSSWKTRAAAAIFDLEVRAVSKVKTLKLSYQSRKR